jgi:hypothetical protein
MGGPTSSYTTTGIALRVSGALKPHHHHKVETPSVGIKMPTNCNYFSNTYLILRKYLAQHSLQNILTLDLTDLQQNFGFISKVTKYRFHI